MLLGSPIALSLVYLFGGRRLAGRSTGSGFPCTHRLQHDSSSIRSRQARRPESASPPRAAEFVLLPQHLARPHRGPIYPHAHSSLIHLRHHAPP